MSEQGADRKGQSGALIDTVEEVATGAARLGYGLLSLPLLLLPQRARRHMHNAMRELSYGLASLPRDLAEIAGDEVERWASGDAAPSSRQSLTIEIAEAPADHKPPARVAPPAAEPAAGMTTTGIAITYIEYDPPGRDIDGEYVLIVNSTAAPVDMTGWVLSDGDANHVYTFPAFSLAVGGEVKLWTKRGADTKSDLYWNSRSAIWNNDGDTGTLKDALGATISVYTYTGKA